MSKIRRSTDYGTVILHMGLVVAFVVAAVTGLRIAADDPEADWLRVLDNVLPVEHLWFRHLVAGMFITAILGGYCAYVRGARLQARVRFDKARIVVMTRPGRQRWAAVNVVVFWVLMSRSVFGFQIRVVGSAPNAARHGGFDNRQTIWAAMLIGGGMAGLAGVLELMGALKTINLGFPSGYGFTAIIVSFLGRLHPIGVLIAGIVLAVTYVGGQVAQTTVHIPNATAGIFQAMMLFFILASDILVRYRVRFIGAPKAAPVPAAGE